MLATKLMQHQTCWKSKLRVQISNTVSVSLTGGIEFRHLLNFEHFRTIDLVL